MGFRKISGIIVVLCLISLYGGFSVTAYASPWKEGQGWGYKWFADFEDKNDDFLENFVQIRSFLGHETKNISLKTFGHGSEMIFIKYLGYDEKGYLFEYRGGRFMNLSYKISFTENSTFVEEKGRKYVLSDYSGKFWLKEDSIGSSRYYGITEIDGNISMKYIIDRDVKLIIDNEFMYENISVYGNTSFENFKAFFKKSIPFIPIAGEINITSGFFTASIKGERKGNLEYHDIDSAKGNESMSMDMNKTIDFDGELIVEAYYSQNSSHFPLLPLSIKYICYIIPSNLEVKDFNSEFSLLDYKVKFSDIFISSIENQFMFKWAGISVESENAAEAEVNKYLKNKDSYLEDNVDNNYDGGIPYLIVGVAIFGVISLFILFIKRIRQS